MTLITIVFFFFFFLFLWSLLNSLGHAKTNQNLPPGPRSLPIIGNLHLLGNLPHQTFTKLAQKYGPLMLLHLGKVPTIVVSSPKTAELFLKKHDAIFSGRPKTQAMVKLSYGLKGIAFTPDGDYLRRVRKMCTLKLLSASKVKEFVGLRRKEIDASMKQLNKAATKLELVDVKEKLAELVEEIIFKMVVGRRKEENKFNLKALVNEVWSLTGASNLADFIPMLAPFDLQGLTKRLNVATKIIDETLESIIEDHLKDGDIFEPKNILDSMLTLMNNPNTNYELPSIDRDNIKAIILDLFLGGIDTTATTITWALALLLKNPRVMKILQEELDTIVGRERMIDETDLPKLSYLDMVVKETLRLYPGGPFLIPHESFEAVVINGYAIPKGSHIFVNVWAIGRDPAIWSANAQDFYPERFVNKNIDIRGQNFELLPFGTGRRICPGINLAFTMVKIILAHFVHCFQWELPNGMQPQDLDMDEKFGLSLARANKLLAIPSPRLH